MTVFTPRTLISPYARRLARERGMALTNVVGSGPAGRIVASDLRSFAPIAVLEASAPAATPTKAVDTAQVTGSFAVTINLGQTRDLLARAAPAGVSVRLDDLLVKAAARAAVGIPVVGTTVVVIDAVGGRVAIERADRLSVGGIAAVRGSLKSDTLGRVSLSRVKMAGVRPVSAALPAGSLLHLMVVAEEGSTSAEALLVYEASTVTPILAAQFLLLFSSVFEEPLQLLV